jgi:hypothetical protein
MQSIEVDSLTKYYTVNLYHLYQSEILTEVIIKGTIFQDAMLWSDRSAQTFLHNISGLYKITQC